MPVHFNPEIGPPPRKLWTFLVSVALHALVLAMLIFGWLSFGWKEINWDEDTARVKPIESVMLAPPPVARVPARRTPEPAEISPLPPPPSPPPPIAPPVLIRPDDLIAEGARPEPPPRPALGNTQEPARTGPAEPLRLLPPMPIAPLAPIAPPAPAAPAAPGALSEPLRLLAPQPPPRTVDALSAPPEAPSPTQTTNNDPARNGLPLAPQIAQNSGSLSLPRLSNGRASSVVDTATQGISTQMAQRPANARTAAGSADRTGNSRGLEQPNFNAEDPQILSDTRGYDFGPYLNQVVNIVRRNWYSLIPESVRYNGQRGNVVLTFTIVKSGAVQDLVLRATSGKEPLDRAAMGSITASNPFQSLPAAFTGDHLTLQFTFLYNVPRP